MQNESRTRFSYTPQYSVWNCFPTTVSGTVFQQQFCCFTDDFSVMREPLGRSLGMEQIDLFSINGRRETHPSLPPEKRTPTTKTHENKETKPNQETEFYKELVYKCMSV